MMETRVSSIIFHEAQQLTIAVFIEQGEGLLELSNLLFGKLVSHIEKWIGSLLKDGRVCMSRLESGVCCNAGRWTGGEKAPPNFQILHSGYVGNVVRHVWAVFGFLLGHNLARGCLIWKNGYNILYITHLVSSGVWAILETVLVHLIVLLHSLSD